MTKQATALENEINRYHKYWLKGQRFWSFVHHGTLIGSAIASLFILFSLQFNGTELFGVAKGTISMFFAILAAVLSGTAAVGGFERKWKTNRLSRSVLDQLRLKSLKDDANHNELLDDLADLVEKHDRQITDDSDESKKNL